jgi:hypothetical protein
MAFAVYRCLRSIIGKASRLAQEHGHARQTCSKALHLLVHERLLFRVPGLGYCDSESRWRATRRPGVSDWRATDESGGFVADDNHVVLAGALLVLLQPVQGGTPR